MRRRPIGSRRPSGRAPAENGAIFFSKDAKGGTLGKTQKPERASGELAPARSASSSSRGRRPTVALTVARAEDGGEELVGENSERSHVGYRKRGTQNRAAPNGAAANRAEF